MQFDAPAISFGHFTGGIIEDFIIHVMEGKEGREGGRGRKGEREGGEGRERRRGRREREGPMFC